MQMNFCAGRTSGKKKDMAETVACVIARAVSTRLPLKTFRKVTKEHTMIAFILERLKRVKNIDEVFLCTSIEPADDIMDDIAADHGVKLYRGSPDAVIERMLKVGEITGAKNLLRITGDNVFTSCEYIDRQVDLLKEHKLDYIRIVKVPLGATAEVMTTNALKRCYAAMDPSVSEYLLLYIFNPKEYRCGTIRLFEKDYSDINLSVDLPVDLRRTKKLLELYKGKYGLDISLKEIIDLIERNNIEGAYM